MAHLISDFYLQKTEWIKNKIENNLLSPYLWLHATLAAALAWLVLWNLNDWWIFAITLPTPLLTDAWKINAAKKVLKNKAYNHQTKAKKEISFFIIDQLLHFILIIVLWLSLTGNYIAFTRFIYQLLPDY